MNKHTEERLAAIVESSFDAIISKDLSGKIISWNKAAERMFGYTVEEAVGQSIYLIIPEDKHDEEAGIFRRLKLGEQIETFETTRRHRDGYVVPISITISPIKSRRGRLVGASTIARDITQTRESERRLRLLMREINHRVKNQYAVVLAIIRQMATRSASVEGFENRIRERIMALSHSHDLLSQVDWAGVNLATLVAHQAKLFEGLQPIRISGPEISLDANAVLNIGMALHELLINSLRFGHAGADAITISWVVTADLPDQIPKFTLTWTESAVEYADLLAHDGGFGALVLGRLVPAALLGHAEWSLSDGKVIWKLTAPVARVQVP